MQPKSAQDQKVSNPVELEELPNTCRDAGNVF